MLNVSLAPKIKYQYASNVVSPSFSGNLYRETWSNIGARNTILNCLREYFHGVEPSVLNEFIELIHTSCRAGRDYKKVVRSYFEKNPLVFAKVKENAQTVAQKRVDFLRNEFFVHMKKYNLSGQTLIDIGSGDGKVTMDLSKTLGIKDITGVEVYELPEHKTLPFKTIIDYNHRLRDCVKGKYTNAAMISTLHHSSNPGQLIKDAGQTINDNGYLILVEHPTSNQADKLFHRFMDEFEYVIVDGNEKFKIPNHIKTSSEWEQMAQEAGFRLVERIEPKTAENPFCRVAYVLQKIPAGQLNEAHKANRMPF